MQVAESDLTTYLAQVQDKTLLASLKFGVGVLHETMTATEKEIVIKLFEAGAIQVIQNRQTDLNVPGNLKLLLRPCPHLNDLLIAKSQDW